MVISECGITVSKFVWLFGGLDEDFCVLQKNFEKVTKGINEKMLCKALGSENLVRGMSIEGKILHSVYNCRYGIIVNLQVRKVLYFASGFPSPS